MDENVARAAARDTIAALKEISEYLRMRGPMPVQGPLDIFALGAFMIAFAAEFSDGNPGPTADLGKQLYGRIVRGTLDLQGLEDLIVERVTSGQDTIEDLKEFNSEFLKSFRRKKSWLRSIVKVLLRLTPRAKRGREVKIAQADKPEFNRRWRRLQPTILLAFQLQQQTSRQLVDVLEFLLPEAQEQCAYLIARAERIARLLADENVIPPRRSLEARARAVAICLIGDEYDLKPSYALRCASGRPLRLMRQK